MNIMPKFKEEQLKGNWGEQYIASQLSSCGCLVRHVTQGHDSGIDLYCESTENGIPFLHFFAQIKTSIKYDLNKPTCSYREKNTEKILYWQRQPVPVFIFLVPDERNNGNPPYFICSVLDFDNTKVSSKIKICNPKVLKDKFLRNPNDHDEFNLINETFKWSLAKGHLSPLPEIEPSGLRWYPEAILTNNENLKLLPNHCMIPYGE